jgi:hypothetical protein
MSLRPGTIIGTLLGEEAIRGWFGEVEGLQVSLAGARRKLQQMRRRPLSSGPIRRS